MSAGKAHRVLIRLGALASGMMLHGISILYGVTGTLDLQELAATLYQNAERSLLPVFGLVFLIVGIAFKLGVVPFDMWIPDVYEGAPTSVTLFLTTAPKLSGFALAMRILVDGLPGLAADWQQMPAVLAVLSMGTGNIVAIAQSNIKRMLACSTIAHMGFMLLGLLAATKAGYAGSMFNVIVYALMGMGPDPKRTPHPVQLTEPITSPWPALAQDAKTLRNLAPRTDKYPGKSPILDPGHA